MMPEAVRACSSRLNYCMLNCVLLEGTSNMLVLYLGPMRHTQQVSAEYIVKISKFLKISKNQGLLKIIMKIKVFLGGICVCKDFLNNVTKQKYQNHRFYIVTNTLISAVCVYVEITPIGVISPSIDASKAITYLALGLRCNCKELFLQAFLDFDLQVTIFFYGVCSKIQGYLYHVHLGLS